MNQRFENSIFVGVLGLEIKACVLSKSQSEAFWSNAGFAAPALLLVLAGFSLSLEFVREFWHKMPCAKSFPGEASPTSWFLETGSCMRGSWQALSLCSFSLQQRLPDQQQPAFRCFPRRWFQGRDSGSARPTTEGMQGLCWTMGDVNRLHSISTDTWQRLSCWANASGPSGPGGEQTHGG